MKKIITIIAIFLSIGNIVNAQDSMYVYQNGLVVSKRAVLQIDSVIFYKAAAPILAIGQTYHGGKIAYILQAGDLGYDAKVPHGLVAAPTDQSTGIQWYNGSVTTTDATGTAIGTGNANTEKIVTNQGAWSYAAQLCADLVLGGYSDWYLPSKDELNKLYINKVAIGGFATNYYWSSTEYDSYVAWFQNFNNGNQINKGKDYPNCVRAIRSF